MKRIIFLFSLLILTSCIYNEILPICHPDQQTFSDLVQPIIESNCIGCHSTADNRPAVLGTYDGVIDAIDNYSLIDKITSGSMPPYGSPEMNSGDINVIKEWSCE
jgi:hypothetical protein